jgi:hypothetical protein
MIIKKDGTVFTEDSVRFLLVDFGGVLEPVGGETKSEVVLVVGVTFGSRWKELMRGDCGKLRVG